MLSYYNKCEDLINNLSDDKLIIPYGTIYAQVPINYKNYTKSQIIKFLGNEKIKFINIGYSSGGARSHNLYRSNNKEIFLVFNSVGRDDRIYYLSQHILDDIINDYYFF